MTFYIFFVLSIMLSLFSIAFYRRIWNPILLFETMFLLGIVLAKGECSSNDFESAIFWILMGEMFFVFSFILAQMIFKRDRFYVSINTVVYNLPVVKKIININVIISIFSLFLGIHSVMQVAPNFMAIFTNSTYVRMLYLQSSGNIVTSIIGLFLSWNFFVTFCFFPIALQNRIKRTIPKLMLVLFIRLFSSLVTMSKEAFLIDVIYFISVYVLMLKDKKAEYEFYKKYGSIFGALIFVLLIVISFQRNYIGQGRYSGYGDAVIGTLRSYISIPIEAFGALVNSEKIVLTHGSICFRPIINILSYLGIGERISISQDVLTNILSANVYTSFGNMYRDFSYIGIIFLSVFFGFFLGTLYKANHNNRISRIVIDAIVMMTMFFAYYDLKIIQTTYLFVMIYAVVLEKVIAKKIYLKYDHKCLM